MAITTTSIVKVSSGDAEVYEAVSADLSAGLLVIPSGTVGATGLEGVTVAGAGALNALGVSMKSAVIAANQAADGSGNLSDDNYPYVDTSVPTATVTVESHGIFPVTYTAAAVAFGARLKCAASGAVAAFVHGTDDPAMVIGYCAQPGGIGSGGGVGLARINL